MNTCVSFAISCKSRRDSRKIGTHDRLSLDRLLICIYKLCGGNRMKGGGRAGPQVHPSKEMFKIEVFGNGISQIIGYFMKDISIYSNGG